MGSVPSSLVARRGVGCGLPTAARLSATAATTTRTPVSGWRGVATTASRYFAATSGGSGQRVTPEEAAETSALCDRTTKLGQTAGQSSLAEDVAHVFGREPTFRELSLFRHEGEPLGRIEDHGYMYGIKEEEIADCSDAVKRAMSTHTAGAAETHRFRIQQVVDKFKLAEFDTGSSRVQVAVITEHIKAMTAHMIQHPHDKHAKRALERYLVRRRKLLQYMMRKDYNNYRIVLRELGLRPVPLFYSKYPPQHLARVRQPHKAIHERRRRVRNPRKRGHKGH